MSRGVYTPEEISQFAFSFDLQQNLAENNQLENLINKKINGIKLTDSENEMFGKFFEMMWNHLTQNVLLLKIAICCGGKLSISS